MKNLHGGFEFVGRQRKHVGIRAIWQHHRVALHGSGEGSQIVAEPSSSLIVQVGGGGGHLLTQLRNHRLGATVHECHETRHEIAVLRDVHAIHTGCAALVDVAEQARTLHLRGPPKDAVAAGPHRKYPSEQVHGLADRPRVRERPEISRASALGPAHHHRSGVRFPQRDCQVGIRLVVAITDVEARVVLLDPGELQLQGFHFSADSDPIHRISRSDQRLRTWVQRGQVGEITGKSGPQVLGLADVQDPTVAIAKAIHARLIRDRTAGGTVTAGIGHQLLPLPQESISVPPSSTTVAFANPTVAGPVSTSPVTALNVLP